MHGPSLMVVPLDKIRLNPVALRDVNKDSQEFQELVDSIRAEGVINPINVRRVATNEVGDDGADFILVDGLQRYTASIEANKSDVPAHILNRTEAEALVTQIIANAHKIDTKPVDYARSIIRILGTNPTLSEAQLATKLNKSPAWLGKILQLNKLSDAAKPLVNEGAICVANAVALAKLPPDEQLNWLELAQTESNTEFGPKAIKRAKEIREANRKGESAGETEFQPIAHLRPKRELEEELASRKIATALIGDTNTEDSALAGFMLGIQWVLNLDPKSVQAQKDKDAARKAKAAEDAARRKVEQTEKRAKVAEENTAKARAAANAAKEQLVGAV